MKNKIFFLLIGVLGLFGNSVFAAETTTLDTTNTPSTIQNPVIAATPALVQSILDAKQQLSNVNLNYALTLVYKNVSTGKGKTKKTAKTLTGYSLTQKDLAVAILNPETNQILITSAIQSGKTFTFPDKNFSIKTVSFNGVNSRFSVSKPAGGKVLALKYLIVVNESGSKNSIESSLSEAIYVPYSPELRTPEVSKYGEQYLNKALAQATSELANVKSASLPGSFVTDAVKPNILKSLLYAEHMDNWEFQQNPNTQELIDKVNVLYAGNQEDTFKYSVSSAGARGIAQFMPSTYTALASRHPEAGLIPNFVEGMNNHVNAIKAEYLLIDDYIAAVQQRIPAAFNPAYAYDYGAASYNGGVARVSKAVQTYGNTWYTNQGSNLNSLQSQINSQSAHINQLKAQLKKAKDKTTKADLNEQISNQTQALNNLKAQYDNFESASLRTETVMYLEKMHKLIPIFNAEMQVASL